MLKKIKRFLFYCKLVWIASKWTFVYLVFKHHLKVFDFTYLMFRGFSYKFSNYAGTIMEYEMYFLCIALFFVIRFIWKITFSVFFRNKIKNFIYFSYFYGALTGIYFSKYLYNLKHFID